MSYNRQTHYGLKLWHQGPLDCISFLEHKPEYHLTYLEGSCYDYNWSGLRC